MDGLVAAGRAAVLNSAQLRQFIRDYPPRRVAQARSAEIVSGDPRLR